MSSGNNLENLLNILNSIDPPRWRYIVENTYETNIDKLRVVLYINNDKKFELCVSTGSENFHFEGKSIDNLYGKTMQSIKNYHLRLKEKKIEDDAGNILNLLNKSEKK